MEVALIRLDKLDEETRAYIQVTKDFNTIADVIRARAGELVDSILQSLKTDVTRIYKKIQDTDAIPDIIIDQNSTDKSILLRVKFYSDERRVPPAGYPELNLNSTLLV